MKRRELLVGLSTTATASLAGCIDFGNACPGETWTGIGYNVRLDEITHNDSTGEWMGRCGVSVSLSFIYDNPNAGIEDAGVALYTQSGELLDVMPLGDMTWKQVPEENRSEMSCGGYERGSVVESREFSVADFPYYVGLWYSEKRGGVAEEQTALKYSDSSSGKTTPSTSDWEQISVDSQTFPPIPEHPSELGESISKAEVITFARECREEQSRSAFRVEADSYKYDAEINGQLPLSEPSLTVGIQRVIQETPDKVIVEMVARDYRRPPVPQCNNVSLHYSVGVTFSGQPPTEYEVVHYDVTGTEISRNTLTLD